MLRDRNLTDSQVDCGFFLGVLISVRNEGLCSVHPIAGLGVQSVLRCPRASQRLEAGPDRLAQSFLYREEEDRAIVNTADLRDLCMRLDERDGGPPWELLMEKRCPGMKYTVWRRDPEVNNVIGVQGSEYERRGLVEAGV